MGERITDSCLYCMNCLVSQLLGYISNQALKAWWDRPHLPIPVSEKWYDDCQTLIKDTVVLFWKRFILKFLNLKSGRLCVSWIFWVLYQWHHWHTGLTHPPGSLSAHEKDLSSQTRKRRGREGTAGKLDSAFSGRGWAAPLPITLFCRYSTERLF